MKRNNGNSQYLGYLTKKFYTFNLRQLTNSYQKGQIFCQFLIIAKGIIFLLLGLYNTDYYNLSQVDTNLTVLADYDFLYQWQTYSYADEVQGLFLALNLIALLYLLTSYIFFIFYGYYIFIRSVQKRSFSQKDKVEVDEDEFLLKMNKIMQLQIYEIMSIYTTLYQNLFSAPILYFCFAQIQHPLAPINLLLAVFTGALILDSDYNYSMENTDCMKRPYTHYNILFSFLDFLVLLLVVVTNFGIDTLFIGIYFLLNGWFTSIVCPYYKLETRFWVVFTQFYCGALSIIFYASIQNNTPTSIPSLMMIFFIPIFYKFSSLYCEIRDQTSLNILAEIFQHSPSLNLADVDRVIRLKFFEDLKNQKLTNKDQVDIYSFIVLKQLEHQADLANQNLVSQNFLSWRTLFKQLGDGERVEEVVLQFLKELIYNIQLKKNQSHNRIIYLVYLLEMMESKRSYWMEYSQQRKTKLSLKEEQILVSVHIDFLKQKEILQNVYSIRSPFDRIYINVMYYEEKLQQIRMNLDLAVQKKVELLAYLRNKQLEVNELVKKVKEIRDMQKKLKYGLNELALINNNNSDIISLQICFLEILAFREKDLIFGSNLVSMNNHQFSQIQGNPNHKFRFQISKKQKGEKNNNNNSEGDELIFDETVIYHNNTCVVFAVINDLECNMVFKRVSNNFQNIFGIAPKEAMGRRIEIIMPSNYSFSKKHREYISEYFTNQDMQNNTSKRSKILFGQTEQGFVVPLIVDIRFNYSILLKEIGLCAFIYQLQEPFDYLLFDSLNLTFVGFSPNLGNNIFTNHTFSKSTHMNQFFPFLRIKFDQHHKQNTNQKLTIITQPQQTVDQNSINTNLGDQTVDKKRFDQTFQFMLITKNISENNMLVKSKQSLYKIDQISGRPDEQHLFFLMDINVCDTGYQGVNNLFYLKISKIKTLSPQVNGYTILKQLKDDYDLYSTVLSKSTIETMQFQIEYELSRTNSFNFQTNKLESFAKLPEFAKKQLFNSPATIQKTNYQYENRKKSYTNNTKLSQDMKASDLEFLKINKIEEEKYFNSMSDQQPQQKQDESEENTFRRDKEEGSSPNMSPLQDKTYNVLRSLNKDAQLSTDIQRDYLSLQSTNRRITQLENTNRQLLLNEDTQNNNNKLTIQQQDKIDEIVISHPNLLSINQLSPMAYNQQLSVKSLTGIHEGNIGSNGALNYQQKFFQNEGYSQYVLNNNESKETTFKTPVKHSAKSLKKKQFSKEHQFEEGSSVSKETTTTTAKRLIHIIRSPTSIGAVKIIHVIGILTFVALGSVTLGLYESLINSLSQSNDNLAAQNWPYEVSAVVNRMMKNMNFIQLERTNNFTFTNSTVQKNFDTYLLSLIAYSSVEYKNLLSYMETSRYGSMFFDKLGEYPSDFYINLNYNPKNLTKTSSRISKNNFYFQQVNVSLHYSIDFINYYMYQQSINPTSKLAEMSVLQNLPDIVNGIGNVQMYFQQYQVSQDSQVQNQLLIEIAIILIVSAVCLLTTLPLYSFVQRKKDIIINLFCTFPTTQLQANILKIKTSYYNNRALMSHVKTIPVEIQQLNSSSDSQNIKKQTLSQITKLPKFSTQIFLLVVVIYIFLSIYPIINKIIVQNYLDSMNNNMQLLQSLCYVRSYILSSSALTAFGGMMKMFPKNKSTQLQTYLSAIQGVVNQTNSALDQLNTASNLASFTGRYQQASFDNFFFPLFEDNICAIVGNNTQYIVNATKFQPTICSGIENGFLQQGLKVSMKFFSGIVQDINSILLITDKTQLQTATFNFIQTMDLKAYSYLIDYLEETINIMKYFLLNNCTAYFNYLQTFLLAILIYQLSLLVIIFGFGWYLFSSRLTNQITQTKHYLQVMSIQNLLENNYIQTFVKNNNKL